MSSIDFNPNVSSAGNTTNTGETPEKPKQEENTIPTEAPAEYTMTSAKTDSGDSFSSDSSFASTPVKMDSNVSTNPGPKLAPGEKTVPVKSDKTDKDSSAVKFSNAGVTAPKFNGFLKDPNAKNNVPLKEAPKFENEKDLLKDPNKPGQTDPNKKNSDPLKETPKSENKKDDKKIDPKLPQPTKDWNDWANSFKKIDPIKPGGDPKADSKSQPNKEWNDWVKGLKPDNFKDWANKFKEGLKRGFNKFKLFASGFKGPDGRFGFKFNGGNGWEENVLGIATCAKPSMFGLYRPGISDDYSNFFAKKLGEADSIADAMKRSHNKVTAVTGSGKVMPQASVSLYAGTDENGKKIKLEDSGYDFKKGRKNDENSKLIALSVAGDGDRAFRNGNDKMLGKMKNRYGAETQNLGVMTPAQLDKHLAKVGAEYRKRKAANPNCKDGLILVYNGHGNRNGRDDLSGAKGGMWYGQNGWTHQQFYNLIKKHIPSDVAVYMVNSSCHSGALLKGPGGSSNNHRNNGDPRNGRGVGRGV